MGRAHAAWSPHGIGRSLRRGDSPGGGGSQTAGPYCRWPGHQRRGNTWQMTRRRPQEPWVRGPGTSGGTRQGRDRPRARRPVRRRQCRARGTGRRLEARSSARPRSTSSPAATPGSSCCWHRPSWRPGSAGMVGGVTAVAVTVTLNALLFLGHRRGRDPARLRPRDHLHPGRDGDRAARRVRAARRATGWSMRSTRSASSPRASSPATRGWSSCSPRRGRASGSGTSRTAR